MIDADHLVAALDADDAHHQAVRSRFQEWQRIGTPRRASAVNVTEALVLPAQDETLLRKATASLTALGVTTDRPDLQVALDAARLRSRHRIALADAILLATARKLDAAVASFDARVLRTAEAERIPVFS